MLIEYAGFFFWGRIAGSVFGYRYRLDRSASHQHCFHFIASSHLKTFWDDSDSDNQDDLEDGNQDLPRTSSPQKGPAKFWADVVVLQWWQRNALKFTAHALSTVAVLLNFVFNVIFVATIRWERHWYQILMNWILTYQKSSFGLLWAR